jgi:hypothetical protein
MVRDQIDYQEFCLDPSRLLISTENIWQLGIPPGCDIVLPGILTQNASLYRVSLLLVQEHQ